MAEEAEEKKLPASDKKLRDARRKGQVPQSRDLVSGFTLFAALAYLYFAWPILVEHILELVRIVTASSGSFAEVSQRAIRRDERHIPPTTIQLASTSVRSTSTPTIFRGLTKPKVTMRTAGAIQDFICPTF